MNSANQERMPERAAKVASTSASLKVGMVSPEQQGLRQQPDEAHAEVPRSPWGYADAAVEFGADFVTLVLGIVAIYGLIRFRKRIGLVIRNLRINHLDDRATEVKVTLDEIEAIAFSRTTAHQLRSLFGRLNGQLIGLKNLVPELGDVQCEVHALIHESARLNDPIKQQLVYHVRGLLKNTKLVGLEEMTKEMK